MAAADERSPLLKAERDVQFVVPSQWKSECSTNNIFFGQTREELFYMPQFRWPRFVFPLYRVIVAGYMCTWLFLTMVHFPNRDPHPWQCYLTNWSFTLLCCHLLLAATITLLYNVHSSTPICQRTTLIQSEETDIENNDKTAVGRDVIPPSLPWYIKMHWVIFSIIANCAFIVSMVYFTLIYPERDHGKFPAIQDFHAHAINSVVIVLEVSFSAIPIRLFHAIYPCIYGWVYAFFSLIYWSYDNSRVLYPLVLDWNRLETTLPALFLLGFVVVPVIQLCLYGVYRLRLKIYRALYDH